jgi:hypothetical protein
MSQEEKTADPRWTVQVTEEMKAAILEKAVGGKGHLPRPAQVRRGQRRKLQGRRHRCRLGRRARAQLRPRLLLGARGPPRIAYPWSRSSAGPTRTRHRNG